MIIIIFCTIDIIATSSLTSSLSLQNITNDRANMITIKKSKYKEIFLFITVQYFSNCRHYYISIEVEITKLYITEKTRRCGLIHRLCSFFRWRPYLCSSKGTIGTPRVAERKSDDDISNCICHQTAVVKPAEINKTFRLLPLILV